MKTLEDYLAQNARLYADKTAVVCGEETCTYSQLYNRVLERSAMLAERRGQVVLFRATPSIDFLVEYFAIHMAGAVAAPLERHTSDERLEAIRREMDGCPVPEGTADVLYTTGTTGRSKGVMVSHRTIIADAENLIEGQLFTHELVFIVNGPLNHIGNLSKIFPVVMLGATLYIVDGMRDINQFFNALDYPAGKMATFFVPANVRMLIQFAADRLRTYSAKIDFIECGGAPLAHADMLTLCSLLPTTRLYNTYASTETGIISTYNYNDGRCLPGCLGRPMSHSHVVITADGHISCKGDTIMSGYIGEPELTATVLKGDTVYMSDLGSIDHEGMLHIGGREDDVINVGGFKVAPTEVEDAAMAMDGVKDCVCIAVQHPITGQALKLLVVMADGSKLDKKKLAHWLNDRLDDYKVPMLYEAVGFIHRTYNGKIDRKAYKQK